MTVKDANKTVKRLVGEDDFHDVEDILASYYSLAQIQIATTVAPIERSFEAECGVTVTLPNDLYRLISVKGSYRRTDAKHIYIDGEGYVTVRYYAYPRTLSDNCDPFYEFEVSPEAQAAIPYYAAAQTVLADSDMRRYYAFMDMYNSILTNVADSNQRASVVTVVDLEAM